MEEIRKRRLVIKAFHAEIVREGQENRITRAREIEVAPESFAEKADHEMIEQIRIRLVHPDQYQEETNSIMDVIPISAKVLGEIGEGVTHTVTGAYVLLTGVDVISSDEELDLLGIIIVGTPDNQEEKMLVGTRAAVLAESMRADGAIISADGWGNSDVDYVNTVEQLTKRGIAVSGLKFVGTSGGFVVESPNLNAIVDINKSKSGTETCVLGENSVTELDARKAAAMLKLKMRRG